MELGEELPEPGRLSHAVSNSAVLCLGTRAGDDRWRTTSVEEIEIDGAAEVAKDPLEDGEVFLPGIMHMETYLLNCKVMSGRVKVRY